MADFSRKPHGNNDLDFAPESARAAGMVRSARKSPGLIARLLGWKRNAEIAQKIAPRDPLGPKDRQFQGSEHSFDAIRAQRNQDVKRRS